MSDEEQTKRLMTAKQPPTSSSQNDVILHANASYDRKSTPLVVSKEDATSWIRNHLETLQQIRVSYDEVCEAYLFLTRPFSELQLECSQAIQQPKEENILKLMKSMESAESDSQQESKSDVPQPPDLMNNNESTFSFLSPLCPVEEKESMVLFLIARFYVLWATSYIRACFNHPMVSKDLSPIHSAPIFYFLQVANVLRHRSTGELSRRREEDWALLLNHLKVEPLEIQADSVIQQLMEEAMKDTFKLISDTKYDLDRFAAPSVLLPSVHSKRIDFRPIKQTFTEEPAILSDFNKYLRSNKRPRRTSSMVDTFEYFLSYRNKQVIPPANLKEWIKEDQLIYAVINDIEKENKNDINVSVWFTLPFYRVAKEKHPIPPVFNVHLDEQKKRQRQNYYVHFQSDVPTFCLAWMFQQSTKMIPLKTLNFNLVDIMTQKHIQSLSLVALHQLSSFVRLHTRAESSKFLSPEQIMTYTAERFSFTYNRQVMEKKINNLLPGTAGEVQIHDLQQMMSVLSYPQTFVTRATKRLRDLCGSSSSVHAPADITELLHALPAQHSRPIQLKLYRLLSSYLATLVDKGNPFLCKPVTYPFEMYEELEDFKDLKRRHTFLLNQLKDKLEKVDKYSLDEMKYIHKQGFLFSPNLEKDNRVQQDWLLMTEVDMPTNLDGTPLTKLELDMKKSSAMHFIKEAVTSYTLFAKEVETSQGTINIINDLMNKVKETLSIKEHTEQILFTPFLAWHKIPASVLKARNVITLLRNVVVELQRKEKVQGPPIASSSARAQFQ